MADETPVNRDLRLIRHAIDKLRECCDSDAAQVGVDVAFREKIRAQVYRLETCLKRIGVDLPD